VFALDHEPRPKLAQQHTTCQPGYVIAECRNGPPN
jgi:hypothetical protein